jgi:putative ABC transport system permease protein
MSTTPSDVKPPLLLPATVKTPKRRRRGLQGFYQSFTSALRALRAKKMRSLLTSLGIIIGVSAVIMMISTSQSNAAQINQRLSNLNPNLLTIRAGSTTSSGVRQGTGSATTLTKSDADNLTQVSHVSAVSPVINASGQIIYQSQNWTSTIQGVYPSYQQVGSWQVQSGSFFTEADEQSGATVAVIGQTVADNLFTLQGIDPVGQQVRIRSTPFTVVGVLAAKGSSSGGASNQDDVVYVPVSTAQQRFSGSQSVNSIMVLVDNVANLTEAQEALQQKMLELHKISDASSADFTIQNQAQILETAQATSEALTTLLVGVAAVSLLVGGIGIMNIMLVSVTERTREIGIRIALGAHPGDVMLQFLIEALLLSTLGGLVGVLIGCGGAFISALVTSRPFVLDPLAVLLAFGFAALVGVVFGFYPARRAARLDPIVALRTE